MVVETRLLRLTSRRRYQMDLCAQEVVVGTWCLVYVRRCRRLSSSERLSQKIVLCEIISDQLGSQT